MSSEDYAVLSPRKELRKRFTRKEKGNKKMHSRMLRYLADLATSLHAAVHRRPFQWTDTEDKDYRALKVLLSQALVVQPTDWLNEFQVFVNR